MMGRKRKGISNIVAAVFLLSISITVASLYANWAPSFSEDVARNAVNQTNRDISCQNAGMSIKDPVYDRSADEILFEIQNTGTIRFNKEITIAAFNSSVPINRTSISSLEVEESISKSIPARKAPDTVIATSPECPSLNVRTNYIRHRD